MGSSQILLLLVVCLSLFSVISASTSISDDVFGQRVVNQRRLLQQLKPCPINFENQNYTVITSQCKAPNYPPKPCCDGFKAFACPIAEYINDLTTDCATTMFSYITTVGKYPAGLFSSLCREGKEGLTCPAEAPQSPSDSAASSSSSQHNNAHNSGVILQLLTMLLLWLQLIVI